MTAHGFRRTPFASRLLHHAMRDRARRETGSPASSTSPSACYLRRTRHARRDRRYWDIFDAAFGSVRAAVPGFTGERCPFEGDHQQLMRNHALALGLIQTGKAAFTAFGADSCALDGDSWNI